MLPLIISAGEIQSDAADSVLTGCQFDSQCSGISIKLIEYIPQCGKGYIINIRVVGRLDESNQIQINPQGCSLVRCKLNNGSVFPVFGTHRNHILSK